MTTVAIMSPPLFTSSHLSYRCYRLLFSVCCYLYVMLFALIQIVTPAILPDASERVRGNRCRYVPYLSLIYCKLHSRRYTTSWAVDSCTTKDSWVWGESESGTRAGRPASLSYSRGAKIYVLSGSCNKTKRVRRCRLGTNMKGSGVWRQGDGAPPEDWMKLSLYNQGASAWLPPPLPSDRWGLPLQMGFSQCYQPTSRVKQCFSSPCNTTLKLCFRTAPRGERTVSCQTGSMFVSLRDHVT